MVVSDFEKLPASVHETLQEPKMLKKEDVDGWNKVFTDCPIKQSDLTQPTEGFLVRALVCYTRRFGYKVEPPFALNTDTVENTRDNRLFLIRLSRQIDHFLKITDKSYSFTYYDLLRPTPKKTAHSLYILLNYLFYYNMYKEEVFKMAYEPIRKFQDINAAIERARRGNEMKIQEVADLKASIEKLDGELSLIHAESKELTKKTEAQKENKKKLNEQRDKLERNVKHLQEQKRLLSRRVVSDEEARDLQKQIDYLKTEFDKYKINEGNCVGKLRELEDSVALLQHSIKEIEKASEIMPKRLLEQMRETTKQIDEANKGQHEAEQRKAKLLQQLEEETQTYHSLDQQYQKEKEEFHIKQKAQMNDLNKMRAALEEKGAQVTALQEEELNLDHKLEEERDISEYLKENITEILAAYMP